MRNSKNKWAFYNLPSRPGLKAEEVLYWKNTLKKILKIGLEFEYNLPEKKNGFCKGNSDTCPCVNLTPDNDCWKQCINTEGCHSVERSTELCKNSTDTCKTEDCASCKQFIPECPGIYCPNFVSYCFVCPKYQTDCDNCQYHYDPTRNPENIRKLITDELAPSNTYGQISKTGVHSVTTDGSLLGKKGAEIITVGRRIDYWEFYRMAHNIIELSKKRGAYLNERCSTHMHVLASYYGKLIPDQRKMSIPVRVDEMERALPEIVLANLHQLVRRYQNAMTWMIMGLTEQHRMTRWEKFRVSVMPISAVMYHMHEVRREIANIAGKNKYGWINYNQVEFNQSGDVSRFHVEFRAADGLNSPSAVAAIACMYYALVIKAVEISRYGVVEIGDKDWVKKANVVKSVLLNNMKGYQDDDRFGDTSNLHKYYDVLIGESLDLVHQLKSILVKVGPAYEVLERLAERPCALRLVNGQTWGDIEDDLKVIMNKEGIFDVTVSEIITLNQVSECKDLDEWVTTVGKILREDPELSIDINNTEVEDTVKNYVTKKREDGELVWSTPIGAPILI